MEETRSREREDGCKKDGMISAWVSPPGRLVGELLSISFEDLGCFRRSSVSFLTPRPLIVFRHGMHQVCVQWYHCVVVLVYKLQSLDLF